MKRPTRLLIYLGIVASTVVILLFDLKINFAHVRAPDGPLSLFHGVKIIIPTLLFVSLLMVFTFLFSSGWALVFMGAIAFLCLLVMAILHPYLFPLLIPFFGLWVACANARWNESHNSD